MAILSICTSCEKILDEKSDIKLATISNIKDLQLMLDDPYIFRRGGYAHFNGSDDFYMANEDLELFGESAINSYKWDPNFSDSEDWNIQYLNIFNMNTILDHLDVGGSADEVNYVKGAALFHRSQCFWQLSQLFCKQYNSQTAPTDLGIVLRLTANFNVVSVRSTVKETYERMLNDLKEAAELLPTQVTLKHRPTKAACFGLLARIYLQMGDYRKAQEYAKLTLGIQSTLLNYNNSNLVNPDLFPPFPKFDLNPEIIYHLYAEGPINTSSRARIDTTLLSLYNEGDLRYKSYFLPETDGSFSYKGSYETFFGLFNGIATDEIYLILAECNARLNLVSDAEIAINALLQNRYEPGFFTPVSGLTAAQLLSFILTERRKELVYRGLRWSDLRRLNTDPVFAITLKRVLVSTAYTLPPNDLRYTLLIPYPVLQAVDLPQNPR